MEEIKIGNKGKLGPGLVYIPYIIKELTPIIDEGDSKRWARRMEIRKRNLKIQKIIDGIRKV